MARWAPPIPMLAVQVTKTGTETCKRMRDQQRKDGRKGRHNDWWGCWHPETMPASSATPHHDSLPGEDMVSPDSVALCSLRDGKTLNVCRSTRLSSSVPSPTLTPRCPLRSQAVRQSTVKKLGNWGCCSVTAQHVKSLGLYL